MLEDKAIVNAEDAVRSIRSGMSDAALKEKYAISQKGLESLFRKLVAAGAIEQPELLRRRGSLLRPTWILSLRNPPRLGNVEKENVDADEPPSEDRSIWQAYKHYFSAFAGIVMGGVSVYLGMTVFAGPEPEKSAKSAAVAAPVAAPYEGDVAQAEQLIRVFEAIADKEGSKRQFQELSKASEYEDCLNNCSRNIQVVEESDKALLINCKRECIGQYAQRVKQIRKRYYENPVSD